MIRRRYVDVPFGQVHVAMTGHATGGTEPGVPLVLLHQTPRSWDEFAEVLAIIGDERPAIAIDLPGMGASDSHPHGASIEHFAEGAIAAIDGLGVDTFDLAGHHTGGVVAIEIAATAPGRVRRLVLSSTPLVDAEGRQARRERPPIDAVEVADDGSHLTELWRRRQRFYPQHRPDLLARFVTDALRAADPEAGHRAVARYEMESRVPLVQAQTLVIGHADDPYAFKEMEPLAAALGAPTVTIDGGMVPLEFTAERFARELRSFLSSAHPTSQRPR